MKTIRDVRIGWKDSHVKSGDMISFSMSRTGSYSQKMNWRTLPIKHNGRAFDHYVESLKNSDGLATKTIYEGIILDVFVGRGLQEHDPDDRFGYKLQTLNTEDGHSLVKRTPKKILAQGWAQIGLWTVESLRANSRHRYSTSIVYEASFAQVLVDGMTYIVPAECMDDVHVINDLGNTSYVFIDRHAKLSQKDWKDKKNENDYAVAMDDQILNVDKTLELLESLENVHEFDLQKVRAWRYLNENRDDLTNMPGVNFLDLWKSILLSLESVADKNEKYQVSSSLLPHYWNKVTLP